MKEYIDQAYGLYINYAPNGSIKSFLEMIETYETENKKLLIKISNREAKKEFKTLLNKAWNEYTQGKNVYRVSHYVDEVEAILNESINQKAA